MVVHHDPDALRHPIVVDGSGACAGGLTDRARRRAPGAEPAPDAILWKRGTIHRLNREVGVGYVAIESQQLSYGFLLGKAILYWDSRDMMVGDRVAFHLDHSGEKVERLVILPKKPRPESALGRRVSRWAMTAIRMSRWLWALVNGWESRVAVASGLFPPRYDLVDV